MNTKWHHSVCVCVWFSFTGWEQCGTRALSSHQAGVQEINLYYLGRKKKEIKSQLAPWSPPSADVFSDSGHLHLNAHWPQQFLVVMQLVKQSPVDCITCWWGGTPSSDANSVSSEMLCASPSPWHAPLPALSLCLSWEPWAFGFLCCLIQKAPSLPIAWNPWNRKEWIAGWHMPCNKTAACE